MKLIKYLTTKTSLTILVTGLVLGGCKPKDFGDTNTSPNGATTPLTSALLTNVESGLGGVPQATNQGFYVQYYSELQYPGNSLYLQTAASWDAFYTGPLEDLQNIINICTTSPASVVGDGNPVNQIQIARIIKAYEFSILTDRYGDIPYSQALGGSLAIAYDKQKDIYTDLFKELTSAVSTFQSTGAAIKGDIIYNGDITKWKKFANSLRLVLAMKLSKIDPATGKAQFTAALNDAGGIISSNADNFTLTYVSTFPNSYSTLSTASFFAISKTIADTLTKYSDPRLTQYGQVVGGKVKGVPYGMNTGHAQTFIAANPDYSLALDASYKTATAPVVIMPAAYIDLIRAQAALDPNYATGENALTLFTKGITDSWAQWNTSGTIATYLTSLGITSAVSLPQVQLQTWLALYGNTQNAWNEWRRTGVPILTPTADAVNLTKTIPRRFAYPTTESLVNGAAYSAAILAFPYGGGDTHDNRVWWDK
jgi:hypothetical protein